ncbi:MAG: hypothetical protein AVDCRST_MAG86-2527 [uncultured Truepera sp.]|uniref:Putative metal-dependent hydrolase AVDCRST_MAG86-2527 n=1 Tax=uncultured Truepera sp. TaxID=543023 RepID=A0A6J4VG86_9DEIN|nr:MAG: hypothetical protein AVDCRST_MAG86-2527 [uncultured Truepera sp.]
MDDARYPIGPFAPPTTITQADRDGWIAVLDAAPTTLRAAVSGLADEQLNTPYREGGWTVRQLVHHLPDSHLNSYVRFKLALTEPAPVIKPYFEERWVELPDTRNTPLEVSLTLLTALHQRWTTLLRAMSKEDFARTFAHPESGVQTLSESLAYYAWHSEHHTTQIINLRQREGWS